MPKFESLVKYESPVLASAARDRLRRINASATAPVISKQVLQSHEEVLNQLLPPRKIKKNGDIWLMFASTAPATRPDILALQTRLDAAIEERQARATGLCAIREEIFNEAFDELLRQITLSCYEHGILLRRVRDELRLTTSAYRTLYESAVAFGIRKTLTAEERVSALEAELATVQTQNSALRANVAELRAELDSLEKRESERRAQTERRHEEELATLKKNQRLLKSQLESMLQC